MNFKKGILMAVCLAALSIAIPQGRVFAQAGETYCSAHYNRFNPNCMECRQVQSKLEKRAEQQREAERQQRQREADRQRRQQREADERKAAEEEAARREAEAARQQEQPSGGMFIWW